MKLPKTLTILGQRWTLTRTNYDPKDMECFGETDTILKNITLFEETIKKFGESEQSTLFHECMHACLSTSGLSALLNEKQEEALVIALENGLYPLVKSGLFK
jgi:hypothetical protein